VADGEVAEFEYDAFISYSRADREVAIDLQKGLERLGKPWYRRKPTVRVLRDETVFGASEDLEALIHHSLDSCGHLVLLLSPASAQSTWVNAEIAYWREAGRSTSKISVAFTAGAAGAAAAERDLTTIDWNGEDVPSSLRGVFKNPLYVDLRWALEAGERTVRNERFEDNVAQIAADVLDKRKDQIIGEARLMRKKAAAIASTIGLVVLSLIATATVIFFAWDEAKDNVSRKEAELAGLNIDLDARKQELADKQQELTAKQQDLLKAQADFNQAKQDADAAKQDAETARQDADAAQVLADEAAGRATEADRLAALAEGRAAEAATRLTQANASLAAAKTQLTTAQRAAAAAQAESDRLAVEVAAARLQLEQVTAEAAALQRRADATRLALDANAAASQGDPALALRLAAESAALTEPPTALALNALVDARTAFSTRRFIPIGVPVSVGDRVTMMAASDHGLVVVSQRLSTIRQDVTRFTSNGPVASPVTDVAAGLMRQIVALSPDGATALVFESKGFADTERSAFVADVVSGDVLDVLGADDLGFEVNSAQLDGSGWFGPDGRVALRYFHGFERGIAIWRPGSAPTVFDGMTFGGFTAEGRVLLYRRQGAAFDVQLCSGAAPAVCGSLTHIDVSGAPAPVPSDVAVRVSPGGESVGIADRFGQMMFFDLVGGQLRGAALSEVGVGNGVVGAAVVAFDASGAAYSVDPGGVVIGWDPVTGDRNGVVIDVRLSITALSFDVDSSTMLVGTSNGTVAQFQLGQGPAIGTAVTRTGTAQQVVALSPDGLQALARSGSSSVNVVHVGGPNAGGIRATLTTGFGFGPSNYALSRRYAVVWGDSGEVWDLSPPTPVRVRLYSSVSRMAIASETDSLAVATGGTIRLVNPADDSDIRPPISVPGPVLGLALSVDGSTLAAVGGDGRLTVWDVRTGSVRSSVVGVSSGSALVELVLSDDGSLVAWTAGSGFSAIIRRVDGSGSPILLTSSRFLGSLDFNASGTLLLAAQGRSIWYTATGERVSGPPVNSGTVTAFFVGSSNRILTADTVELTTWDAYDPLVACSLAEGFMAGRDLAPYTPVGRELAACGS
jgi:hypothetical protein